MLAKCQTAVVLVAFGKSSGSKYWFSLFVGFIYLNHILNYDLISDEWMNSIEFVCHIKTRYSVLIFISLVLCSNFDRSFVRAIEQLRDRISLALCFFSNRTEMKYKCVLFEEENMKRLELIFAHSLRSIGPFGNHSLCVRAFEKPKLAIQLHQLRWQTHKITIEWKSDDSLLYRWHLFVSNWMRKTTKR